MGIKRVPYTTGMWMNYIKHHAVRVHLPYHGDISINTEYVLCVCLCLVYLLGDCSVRHHWLEPCWSEWCQNLQRRPAGWGQPRRRRDLQRRCCLRKLDPKPSESEKHRVVLTTFNCINLMKSPYIGDNDFYTFLFIHVVAKPARGKKRISCRILPGGSTGAWYIGFNATFDAMGTARYKLKKLLSHYIFLLSRLWAEGVIALFYSSLMSL